MVINACWSLRLGERLVGEVSRSPSAEDEAKPEDEAKAKAKAKPEAEANPI